MTSPAARPPTLPGRSPTQSTALRVVAVLVLLFVFLAGVKLLGDGFKHLGRGFIESFFSATANPFIGLMVGILTTTLVQSSSVTTSMIVGLVAAPVDPLPIANAIPMIMGANIGTTVTNTLVSLAHIQWRDEFRRAFAVATCHDFFNFIAVAILLPLELLTGFLRRTATYVATHVGSVGGAEFESPLKHALGVATAPVIGLAESLFAGRGQGVLLILVAAVLIYLALILIVRTMRAVMESRVESFLTRALDRSIMLSLLLGTVATVMVQSSSITTALLVPLAGAGLITVRQAFPITVGANIGTTVTALLASLAATGPNATAGLTIALVHLLFNVTGAVLILPVPAIRDIPIRAATGLAAIAARSRRWAVVYVFALFYILPGILAIANQLRK